MSASGKLQPIRMCCVRRELLEMAGTTRPSLPIAVGEVSTPLPAVVQKRCSESWVTASEPAAAAAAAAPGQRIMSRFG